ncbi:unnamed protein product [Caenorhabditis auriculariae]|uniref:DNA-directed RNA polymerase n=1 Tax=Caenorhabditis auriculariae TaxID=2777116 RepID=A0A8S1GNR5_9PELO|nr:unnamed protein product [Caenorhabditis auriculariae]
MWYTTQKLPVLVRWPYAFFSVRGGAVSTNSLSEKLTKKRENSADWKSSLIKTLSTEYKEQIKSQKSYWIRKSAQAQIMRYTIKDDMQSLVRFAENHARVRTSTSDRDEEGLLAICLFVMHKKFSALSPEEVNSSDALTLFLSLGDLWPKLRRLGTTGDATALLLLNTLTGWESGRRRDEASSDVTEILESMRDHLQRNIRSLRLDRCNVFLSEDEKSKIAQEWLHLSGELPKSSRSSGEDKYQESPLVESLASPCSQEDYFGNPFHVGDLNIDYLREFDKHLSLLESSAWLHVPNTVGNRKGIEKHAEDVILEWRWKEKIEKNIELLSEAKMHPAVGSCLSAIPKRRLAELLHGAAVAVCSQGQNLVSISSFHYDLVTPIAFELQEAFKKKLGYSENELWRTVFLKYVRYFSEEEISRTYSQREWWTIACREIGIAPEFQFPLGQIDGETRQQMATVFAEILVKSCAFPLPGKGSQPAFSYKSVAAEEESRISAEGRVSLSRMLAVHPKMMQIFDEFPFRCILFTAQQLPMTIPPRPWIDYGVGGPLYKTRGEIIRNISEYKCVDINSEVRKRIKSAKQGRPVFDALNQLGSTPWVINEKMLSVLRETFLRSGDATSQPLLEKLGVPMRADTVQVPEYNETFGNVHKKELDQTKWRDYAKRRAEVIKKRNESNSLWCWMLYRVVLADHYKGQVLFFPHNMDFRGRVYPLSPYLSHMGDDVNRCILKFAKAQKLGKDGLRWLKLHCINLTGKLKRSSIAERILEAERVLPAILDSASDPFGGEGWWMLSEDPWQTLAACIEIHDAINFSGDVSDFPSQLPVHQDGSCNGLQHYAALGRDKEGGVQVNLTSSELPNDVYSDVAQRVEQKRKEDENGGEDCEVARKLRSMLPQEVPRKVIKQTVMTTVYGVTMYGAVLQIKRQLRALEISNEDAALFARYLARKTFASLNDAFTSSMMLKDWFRSCAKATSELMRTVEWTTPLGLPVVQPYLRPVDKQGKLLLSPVSTKQVDAFPPNFVHSLDSTHMMLTSLHSARRGYTFAAVHDCYWTHANSVDAMNQICREQFVALHSLPLVQQCSEWFNSRYLPRSVTRVMTEEEVQKYRSIFTPQVVRGELDIHDVCNSVYFFS